MKKFSWIMMLLLFLGQILPAQSPVLVIGTETVCAGQEVLVPVKGYDLNSIGAITLFIGIDMPGISFISLENVDSQLEGYSAGLIGSQIGFAWSGILGASFADRKLFDIRLLFHHTPSELRFDPGCELADVSTQQVITVHLDNGGIQPGNPVIINEPLAIRIKTGQPALFSVSSANAQNYTWKESADNGQSWTDLQDGGRYSGCSTGNLSIADVPLSYHNYIYKCLLGFEDCLTLSDTAILLVDSPSALKKGSESGMLQLRNSPNPAKISTTIRYSVPENGVVTITLYSVLGIPIREVINEFQLPGSHQVPVDLRDLAPGVYPYHLEFTTSSTNFTAVNKLIKE